MQNSNENKHVSALLGTDDRILSFSVVSLENPLLTAEENEKSFKKFEETMHSGCYPVKRIVKYKDSPLFYFIINVDYEETSWILNRWNLKGGVFAIRDRKKKSMTYEYHETGENNKLFMMENVTTETEVEEFFSFICHLGLDIDFDLLEDAAKEMHDYLDRCIGNGEYFRRLRKQVYGDCVHGFARMMNRGFMYETPEHKKEREERVANSTAPVADAAYFARWHEQRKLEITEKFDQFVKEYNESVKNYNSKYKLKPLPPLIEGKYTVNDQCTIDIEGNFNLEEMHDFTIVRDSEKPKYEKSPFYRIEFFSFKINKVTGNFRISSTHLHDLEAFPRVVEGNVEISGNPQLKTAKCIEESDIKGNCFIEYNSENLYFPGSVGGNLRIENPGWKKLHLKKPVNIGGRFTFLNMSYTDPEAQEIKEKILAKEYKFGEAEKLEEK